MDKKQFYKRCRLFSQTLVLFCYAIAGGALLLYAYAGSVAAAFSCVSFTLIGAVGTYAYQNSIGLPLFTKRKAKAT